MIASANETGSFFKSAVGIWPSFQEVQVNQFIGFRVAFLLANPTASISVAAASLYRLTCNGRFVGHGPARTAHGYLRVDQWSLDDYLQPGGNLVALEVAAYNANTFYTLDEPGYLQAEVTSGGETVASTFGGGSHFQACHLSQRVQKVPRYSFQRTFVECYQMAWGSDLWKTERDFTGPYLECSAQPPRQLLPRRCALPSFELVRAQPLPAGEFDPLPLRKIDWNDRSLTFVGPTYKGFPPSDLEINPATALTKSRSTSAHGPNHGPVSGGMYDLGRNVAGFIGCSLTCRSSSILYLTFDEILIDGDIVPTRLETLNIIRYSLEPGRYTLETFEPYSFRFVRAEVFQGECEIHEIYAREFAASESQAATFLCDDTELNEIFASARETFRFNTVDLFMDCPSRERAGWLNDSLFSARSALLFSGNLKCETAFLENFLLAPELPGLPFGMFPMCYPSDIVNHGFCPNLPCWFICELEEFVLRGGDCELVRRFHSKVKNYFSYLEKFTNELGLIEALEGWVFVEWSRANDWTQDVNIPSNLLYADALAAGARLFQDESWMKRAEEIRSSVARVGFDGTRFIDNLVRVGKQLAATANSSEICQYHAFYSGIATPANHLELWRDLVKSCALSRKKDPSHPLAPANLISGGYLRLDLLTRYGECAVALKELRETFGPMARSTGTLWEHLDTRASCCHGIAAYVAVILIRAASGLRNVDTRKKLLHLDFRDLSLQKCSISHPAGKGQICLQWEKQGDNHLIYFLTHPPGYSVQLEITPELQLETSSKPLFQPNSLN